MYWGEKLSARKIGKIFQCSETTIRNRLHDFRIAKKTASLARMRYDKKDFTGSQEFKAYLIAFRIGDMNVYQTSPQSDLIVARSNTTQFVQVDLIKNIFSPYGKVTVSQGVHSININCYLNKTFDFLLPKNEQAWQWIKQSDSCSWSFIAGYVDAEANFIINQGKARFKIDSYDYEILIWIHYYLNNNGVKAKLRCISEKDKPTHWAKDLNKDLWRLDINSAYSLDFFIQSLRPYCQHATRINQMKLCEANIVERISKGSI